MVYSDNKISGMRKKSDKPLNDMEIKCKMNKQIKQCEMATYYVIPIKWHSGKWKMWLKKGPIVQGMRE